jgi:acetyl-CoA carboxylase biotin carboxyl carrier protein
MVGFFSEGKAPVEQGATVEASTVVGVITALGLANDVPAGVAGEVVEKLVAEGDPVEFGQPLFRVEARK